jgi:hypothetical protein
LVEYHDSDNNVWVLSRRIGRGGDGVVYLTRPLTEGHYHYVVKMDVHSRVVRKKTSIANEMRMYARIRHPLFANIVAHGQVFGGVNNTFDDDSVQYDFFIIPRYNVSMKHHLGLLRKNKQSLPIERVKSYAVQLFQGLDYLQNQIKPYGILHRDIKNQNLMLKDDQIVLIDFGMAVLYNKHQRQLNEKRYREYLTAVVECTTNNSKLDDRRLHRMLKDTTNIDGTIDYAGYDAHLHMNTPRADVNSVLYLLLQWMSAPNFKLPWQSIDQKYIAWEKWRQHTSRFAKMAASIHLRPLIDWFVTLKATDETIDFAYPIEAAKKI